MTGTALTLAIAALILGAIIGYLFAVFRNAMRAADVAAELGRRDGKIAELTARAERQAEDDSGYRSVLKLIGPLEAKLGDLQQRVAAADRDRVQQSARLARQLEEQAAAGAELTRSTTMLAGALRNASSRGLWGEVELERLVEAAGLQRHVDYQTQRVLPGGSRPDMVIALPGDGAVAIDAKVPFDSFLLAAELAEEVSEEAEQRRAELLADHAKAVRRHVDALARRDYPDALAGGPDVTVMFVPAEPLLAAACAADPGLLEHALRNRVCLATPVSLLALLRNVAVTWSREEVSERAEQLLDASREMVKRLATFADHLDAVGKHLGSSVQAYNRAVGSFDTRLAVQAHALAEMNLGEVPDVRQLDVTNRSVAYAAED